MPFALDARNLYGHHHPRKLALGGGLLHPRAAGRAQVKEEATRNDYNLSPSCYVAGDDVEPPLPRGKSLVLLAEAEEERRETDAELNAVLTALGFTGWHAGEGDA
jgi:hypothetical protein